EPAKTQELTEESPQMCVMRLRQALDLALRHTRTEHPAKVLENDRPAHRQRVIQNPAGDWSSRAGRQRQRHGRGADAIVGERDDNGANALLIDERLRPGTAYDLRRAVAIARHREVDGLDQTQRELARKELGTRLLGGEARRQARCPARPLAAVGELLR